ncbi:MAG: tyrosine-type recombinase/integrase [Bryobacteraceae bacterium]
MAESSRLFLAYGRAERNYAHDTLGKFNDCLRSWVLPQWAAREVESIDRLDVIRLRTAMADRKLSTNRQYSVLMVLKLLFKFCREILRLSCLDPTKEIPLPHREKPHVQYLTNEEVQRLFAAIPIHTFSGLRLRVLVEVLLATGLRISEALALNRMPFELGQREVEISGKGGKKRTVFFPERTLLWIKRLLARRADDFPALFVTTGEPRRVARADMSKVFIALRRRAQIDKKLTPHMLRHTYCTNLLLNGADITFIKELAGHSDIQTTAKYYLGVDKRALREVVNRCLNYDVPDHIPPPGRLTGPNALIN